MGRINHPPPSWQGTAANGHTLDFQGKKNKTRFVGALSPCLQSRLIPIRRLTTIAPP